MTGHIPPLPFGRPDGWNGLNDGQEWNAEPGIWQARMDPKGRAHVIGRLVAMMLQNPDGGRYGPNRRGRRWYRGPNGYDRAMRAARLHNAMVKAASS